MSDSKKPTWSASGVVDAPPKEVWKALVRFLEQSGLGKVTVDEAERRVSLQGEWWYRGEHIVKDHNGGSLIQYRVYNIAPGTTRWMVPLFAPSKGKLREQFQDLLRTLGQTLRAGARYRPSKISSE
ncbi:hypothetical protein Arub01_21790 [Actinomadura rubrobrunea]|uniref:Uncharacterized protein n=1 Tax=Actinomadura rubrobrunea TaxID=115335 RepID=A0A9W6UWR0_9ACTN|nr:hypothetical protein [Actinomadura rubrobrunea]GLW63935.1 hypothetical protein Arub01_21790 [Actinomadura rubrobrunea]